MSPPNGKCYVDKCPFPNSHWIWLKTAIPSGRHITTMAAVCRHHKMEIEVVRAGSERLVKRGVQLAEKKGMSHV
jgi:hypothetical protein